MSFFEIFLKIYFLIYVEFFGPYPVTRKILVRIKLAPISEEAENCNHWISKKAPGIDLFYMWIKNIKMGWKFLSPQNMYVETLNPAVMILKLRSGGGN